MKKLLIVLAIGTVLMSCNKSAQVGIYDCKLKNTTTSTVTGVKVSADSWKDNDLVMNQQELDEYLDDNNRVVTTDADYTITVSCDCVEQ